MVVIERKLFNKLWPETKSMLAKISSKMVVNLHDREGEFYWHPSEVTHQYSNMKMKL